MRIAVTGDRFWPCNQLAVTILRRLVARYGPGIVIVHQLKCCPGLIVVNIAASTEESQCSVCLLRSLFECDLALIGVDESIDFCIRHLVPP